ncbi:hypothetical protein, partial [Aeromonas jandaei]|uniref:hypothetical protein n=1 Tax=Aeromonas jandaei TaxID=650 RepID=UPI003BA3D959
IGIDRYFFRQRRFKRDQLPSRFFIWSGVSYRNRPLFFPATPIQTGSIAVTVFHLVRREL